MSNTAKTSRRDVLKITAAGLAGTALRTASLFAQQPVTAAPETPEQAVEVLVQGNRRFVEQALNSCSADMSQLRLHSEAHQSPFAAVLSCADSRVPPELVFDQPLGQIFTVRVAGNVATPDTIASLEYSGALLGVKTILVMGHTNCGAIKAASTGGAVPGQISTLFQYLHPAVAGITDLSEASGKNARLQTATLREASPVLAELVAAKKLSIRAAIYDVHSGTVTLLEG